MTNGKRIRVCALMLDPFDTTPGQRFRLEQWDPYLKESGIDIDYFSFTSDSLRKILYKEGHFARKAFELTKAILKRMGHVRNSSDYDIIYLFRTATIAGPALLERILGSRSTPVIYDFDDAIYLTNTSDANRNFGWLKFADKTDDICKLSTSVSVGNSHLAQYAGNFNENVFIIPTSIDTNKYQPQSGTIKKNGRTVIGWTGSSTSQYHLEAFEPILAQLLSRREDVEIRVISNREPSFEKIPYTWREWSPETEVQEISEIEIGIMPTPDDEWSRGKCALKALQYMSLGIPAICTDMGANRDVIDHGKNGYLAKTSDDWLSYFDQLVENDDLRLSMGTEARATVLNRYSMKKCAELFADAVRKTIDIKSEN